VTGARPGAAIGSGARETLAAADQRLLDDAVDPVRKREREHDPDREVDELGREPARSDHHRRGGEPERMRQVERVADAAGEPHRRRLEPAAASGPQRERADDQRRRERVRQVVPGRRDAEPGSGRVEDVRQAVHDYEQRSGPEEERRRPEPAQAGEARAVVHQEGEDAAGENRRIRSQRAAARAERDRNLEHEHQRECKAEPPAPFGARGRTPAAARGDRTSPRSRATTRARRRCASGRRTAPRGTGTGTTARPGRRSPGARRRSRRRPRRRRTARG